MLEVLAAMYKIASKQSQKVYQYIVDRFVINALQT